MCIRDSLRGSFGIHGGNDGVHQVEILINKRRGKMCIRDSSQRGKTAPAQLWLIGFSLWFYAWANPAGLTVLAGSIAVNYALCRRLEGLSLIHI